MWIAKATAHVNHAANRHMNCLPLELDGFGNAMPTTAYTMPNSATRHAGGSRLVIAEARCHEGPSGGAINPSRNAAPTSHCWAKSSAQAHEPILK